ncbi:MAG: helix-turn-helix transcriptional regulator [Lachnospiraceae bacterium]|nr:helix-turn-helix transcriptional regulator [Lachnospiraceae bacterium]
MSPRLKEERYSLINYKRLKELMKEENVTLQQLSESINVNYPNLCRNLTKGKIQTEWLNSIADYLDISVQYLSGETDIKLRRFVDEKNKYNSRELLSLYLISRGFQIEELSTKSIKDSQLIEIDAVILNALMGRNWINVEILETLNNKIIPANKL